MERRKKSGREGGEEREEGGRWTERKGRKDRGREGRRQGDEEGEIQETTTQY